MEPIARAGRYNIILFISFVITLVTSSCVDTRKAIYFDSVHDSTFYARSGNLEPVIQKNDLLSITVSSLNPEANRIFNSPTSQSSSDARGYLVSQEGNIEFPFLGLVKAEGILKSQLKSNISRALSEKKLLVDPIVDIRYLNFKISVLGEVAHPGVLIIPNERVTIFEALGLAGDVTIFAKRDNILLIRETPEGSKSLKRLNLNTTEIFGSPYYYLKSNDVVYVEPNKSKIAQTGRGAQILPIVFSGLSFVAIVLDRLIK